MDTFPHITGRFLSSWNYSWTISNVYIFYIIFIAHKAPICLVFVIFFTHFKWSKSNHHFLSNPRKTQENQALYRCCQDGVSLLPWQTKSTRILIKTPFKMRCPAVICSNLRGVDSSLCIGHFCTYNANLSIILQHVYSKRSRNGVKQYHLLYELLLLCIKSAFSAWF